MKAVFRSLLLILLVLASAVAVAAQSAAAAVENLRAQLADVQEKELTLQARMKQLDEDLRPENIERFFALNGSTKPEELREQRRKQLEGQKANVQTQLDQIATSRTRLQTSIAAAEAAASRQSALPPASDEPSAYSGTTVTKPKPVRRTRRARARRARRRG